MYVYLEICDRYPVQIYKTNNSAKSILLLKMKRKVFGRKNKLFLVQYTWGMNFVFYKEYFLHNTTYSKWYLLKELKKLQKFSK